MRTFLIASKEMILAIHVLSPGFKIFKSKYLQIRLFACACPVFFLVGNLFIYVKMIYIAPYEVIVKSLVGALDNGFFEFILM